MASRGVNKVTLLGNLGQDPEIRYMPDGSPVANLSLATGEVWKDKESGEQHEKTEWHRVVVFRKLAEIVGQYCKKGSKIYVEGKLQTRKWTDQQNIERYTTEIIANEIQLLPDGGQRNGPPPLGDKHPPAHPSADSEANVGNAAGTDTEAQAETTHSSSYASAKGKPAKQNPAVKSKAKSAKASQAKSEEEQPPLPEHVPGDFGNFDDDDDYPL